MSIKQVQRLVHQSLSVSVMKTLFPKTDSLMHSDYPASVHTADCSGLLGFAETLLH